MKLLSDFGRFEKILESIDEGRVPSGEGLNEGIFSGILNFFSRVFGGRIDQLDRIIDKYRRNEESYWERWANANHDYNRAAARSEMAKDAVSKRRAFELMERANKLIGQVNKTRDDVNDALMRQASMIIRSNRRMRSYWEMKKAKADEEVARSSYDSLKDKVDEDLVNKLYDRIEKTGDVAKEKMQAMPKGAGTIEFGTYEDESGEDTTVPFSNFGVHDLDDFVFSDDQLWNERVALMPKGNLSRLTDAIQRNLRDIKDATDAQVEKLKKKLDGASDEEKSRIDNDMKYAQKYYKDDVKMLSGRLSQVASAIKEGPKGGSKPASGGKTEAGDKTEGAYDEKLNDMKDGIGKRTGLSGTALDDLHSDMVSLFYKMPDADRSDDKLDIRIGQLTDYSMDVMKYKEKNGISGKLPAKDVAEVYSNFRKEFPI